MFQTLQWLNKNQEAIKSTQLQQCTTDMPVIWVKLAV